MILAALLFVLACVWLWWHDRRNRAVLVAPLAKVEAAFAALDELAPPRAACLECARFAQRVAAEPEPHANVYVPRCGLIPIPARHAVRWVAGGDA